MTDRTSLQVKRIKLAFQQVAEQIRELVVAGEIVPGQRLPSEQEFARMFGVGRTTIRESLRLLSAQGIVVTRRGGAGGTFIVSPDRDLISSHIEANLGLLASASRPGVEQLLEARILLEEPATRLAALRHSEEDLAAVALTMETDAVSNERMRQSKFHVAILRASGNQMLEVMTRPVFDVLRTRLVRSAASPEFWDRVVAEHEYIFAALKARDGDEAASRMREHLLHLNAVYSAIDADRHPDLDGHMDDGALREDEKIVVPEQDGVGERNRESAIK